MSIVGSLSDLVYRRRELFFYLDFVFVCRDPYPHANARDTRS